METFRWSGIQIKFKSNSLEGMSVYNVVGRLSHQHSDNHYTQMSLNLNIFKKKKEKKEDCSGDNRSAKPEASEPICVNTSCIVESKFVPMY